MAWAADELDAALRINVYQRRLGPRKPGDTIFHLEEHERSAIHLLRPFQEVSAAEYAKGYNDSSFQWSLLCFPVLGRYHFFQPQDDDDDDLLFRLSVLFGLIHRVYELLDQAEVCGSLALADINEVASKMITIGSLLTELGLVTSSTWLAGEACAAGGARGAAVTNESYIDNQAEYQKLINQFQGEGLGYKAAVRKLSDESEYWLGSSASVRTIEKHTTPLFRKAPGRPKKRPEPK